MAEVLWPDGSSAAYYENLINDGALVKPGGTITLDADPARADAACGTGKDCTVGHTIHLRGADPLTPPREFGLRMDFVREVGRVYDTEHRGLRSRWQRLLNLKGSWAAGDPAPRDVFAQAYALCWLDPRQARVDLYPGFGYAPSLARHRRIFRALKLRYDPDVDPLVYGWRALQVAAGYWEDDLSGRCPGGVVITEEGFDPNAAPDEPGGTDAYTTLGAGCVIWVSPELHSSLWGAFSRTIVHEYGHLLGHTHDDPAPIMHPLGGEEFHASVPGCGNPYSRGPDWTWPL